MFHAVLFWQGTSIFRKTFEFYLSVWPQFIGKCKKFKTSKFFVYQRFFCPVGPRPGQKSAERAGPWQNFTGLSRMDVPRDNRDRDRKRGTVPSRLLPIPGCNLFYLQFLRKPGLELKIWQLAFSKIFVILRISGHKKRLPEVSWINLKSELKIWVKLRRRERYEVLS